jgi:hypothetical protein
MIQCCRPTALVNTPQLLKDERTIPTKKMKQLTLSSPWLERGSLTTRAFDQNALPSAIATLNTLCVTLEELGSIELSAKILKVVKLMDRPTRNLEAIRREWQSFHLPSTADDASADHENAVAAMNAFLRE